jgi:hypothetical protein
MYNKHYELDLLIDSLENQEYDFIDENLLPTMDIIALNVVCEKIMQYQNGYFEEDVELFDELLELLLFYEVEDPSSILYTAYEILSEEGVLTEAVDEKQFNRKVKELEDIYSQDYKKGRSGDRVGLRTSEISPKDYQKYVIDKRKNKFSVFKSLYDNEKDAIDYSTNKKSYALGKMRGKFNKDPEKYFKNRKNLSMEDKDRILDKVKKRDQELEKQVIQGRMKNRNRYNQIEDVKRRGEEVKNKRNELRDFLNTDRSSVLNKVSPTTRARVEKEIYDKQQKLQTELDSLRSVRDSEADRYRGAKVNKRYHPEREEYPFEKERREKFQQIRQKLKDQPKLEVNPSTPPPLPQNQPKAKVRKKLVKAQIKQSASEMSKPPFLRNYTPTSKQPKSPTNVIPTSPVKQQGAQIAAKQKELIKQSERQLKDVVSKRQRPLFGISGIQGKKGKVIKSVAGLAGVGGISATAYHYRPGKKVVAPPQIQKSNYDKIKEMGNKAKSAIMNNKGIAAAGLGAAGLGYLGYKLLKNRRKKEDDK